MESILFVSLMNGAAWGGSEQLWHHAALYARQQGHQVGVVCYQWPQKLEKLEILKQQGIKVWEIPGGSRRHLGPWKKIAFDLFTKPRQAKWVKRFNYKAYDTAVISQGGSSEVCHGPWKSLWTKLPPYLLLFQSYSERFEESESKKKWLLDWVLHARQNLFVSARIADLLKSLGPGFENIRWATLINPVTVTVPNTSPVFPPVRQGVYLFGMVATMDFERKAQDQLLKVLGESKWLDRPWELWLYGGGPDAAKASELVMQLGLSQKVRLAGHTNDMAKALEPLHLMLHMTRQEGMPIVVMDAMAMAKPLVVSPVGDMPQWVSEGKNGWIAAGMDVAAMDQALELAWQQRHLWEAMGQHSFNIFQRRYGKHPGEHLLGFLKLS